MRAIPRSELRELFVSLSGIENVYWEGETDPSADLHGILSDSADIRFGTDEYRSEVLPNQTLKETYVGRRAFTLHFEIRDYSGVTYPQDLAEQVRMRLNRQGVRDTLNALNLSVADVFVIKDRVAKISKTETRISRRAVLDVILNWVVVDIDQDSPGGWIEKVNDGGDIPGP